MPTLPRDSGFDGTLALLFSDGYRFIQKRCRRYETDLFETRLALQRVICMSGAEAAEVFYAPGRFTRRGAMPRTALWLLQGEGSVSVQDGAAHRRRKEMFMSLMGPGDIQRLTERFAEEWRARLEKWERQSTAMVLHEEAQAVLCRAVCAWAGVPLTEREAQKRTREFAAMIDGAGAVGPRNWWGLFLRRRTERWARRFVEAVRAGSLDVPEGSAAHVIATHRDRDGDRLDASVAAVELLNVLRPTVAVARFVTFAALALHEHPACRQQLRANQADGDDDYLEHFVQEVRRYYAFFPFIGGRVREPFDWRGHHFTEGTWVLLDLYGTDHDERVWEDPEAFRPERFAEESEPDAFEFIPQGGGDHFAGHRCAGEWVTIALMKAAVRLLTDSMQYDVPAQQDLTIPLTRMPTLPKSGFAMRDVRRTPS
jgi:fatty-acid peroxygenase